MAGQTVAAVIVAAGRGERAGHSEEGPKQYRRIGSRPVIWHTLKAFRTSDAIDRIVAARCARESTCNNVGVDKRYASSQACSQKLKADMKDDLNVNECPRGIDQKELNECLESIQKEDCNNPIDAISRLAACRTSDLCLATGAPNR